MRNVRQAYLNTVHKYGWGILAAVAAICMAQCLRSHQLHVKGVLESLALGVVGMLFCTVMEYLRLRRS